MMDDSLDEKSRAILESSKQSDPICWMLLSDEVVHLFCCVTATLCEPFEVVNKKFAA